MPRLTFFIGKGGVGKTTVSAAYALHRAAAEPRRRFLLLSTDPAHSLADVLQTKVGDRAKRLRSQGQVWARQLDADRQIERFLANERDDLLALLSKGSLFTRDELEPLLDASLPGMAEVAALLAVDELLDSDYHEVVVDTAPMGHAIRLLQMPEHFARLLDVLETAAGRDRVLATHFQGRVQREPALDRWAEMVNRVRRALSAEGSRLVLVTTPEPFSLNESVRAASVFAAEGAQQIAEVVLNRAVIMPGNCSRCRTQTTQTAAARKFLAKHFPSTTLFLAHDPGSPILGISSLRAFGAHVFEHRRLPSSIRSLPPKAARISLQPMSWPDLSTPLTLTLGKGGVGKTTISAALAFNHRQVVRRDAVTICSIDPAPSLGDVFLAKAGNKPTPVLRDSKLLAVEFDAVAQYRLWTEELRARLNQAMTANDRGVHIDLSLDRKFLLALLDVIPPGVDELFAVFRILDLLHGGGRVVIDMAPTGHALEVLRTPARLLAWSRLLLKMLAAHRSLPIAQDAAVEVAKLSQQAHELADILRDPKRSSVVVVTLPEPLPNYETQRLRQALKDLRAPVRAVIVNRVLSEQTRCPRCKLAAQWQAFSLAKLKRDERTREILIARESGEPIAGAKALRNFTRELWRLE